MGDSQLKPRTCPTTGLTLLGFSEELEVHILPSFHPNSPFSLLQSRSTVTAGSEAAALGGTIWRRAKVELSGLFIWGGGKGSRCMYIYIQSRTIPPRKRPRERILHEKFSRLLLLLLILFKSWGCAPKCSLWSASGDGSSLASGASEPRRWGRVWWQPRENVPQDT